MFKNLDKYLDKAEELFGPYIWGNYSILVMPPSFPYGAMENPLLTFASGSLLTAGGNQAEIIAVHEIMHSWFGNQYTISKWQDTWLKEGLTVYAERVVTGEFYGEERNKVNAFGGLYALN